MNRGKEGEQINQKNEKDQTEWCSIVPSGLAGSEKVMKQFVNKSIELGNWGLSIVWNLVLGIWDLTNKGVKMGKIFFSLPRPQWERACPVLDTGAGMRVKLGCLLFIAGLCFGQFIEPGMSQKLPQPISSNLRMKQYCESGNPMIRKISFYRNPAQFNTMLMVQVEGESLQPKNSFWKQTGIYGLEFAGGFIGTFPSFYRLFQVGVGDAIDDPSLNWWIYYTLCNALFTGTCTWTAGKILRQKGSWLKTSVGAGVGSLIGNLLVYGLKTSSLSTRGTIAISILCVAPL
ncbi:MAG: hypothetical protein ABIL40_00655 [candidate division WOR-3 bacterium]